ncbi:MAG: DUF4358 domain-containing protein [Clostridium sp.]|uniref:DUF4358 domain-containing protein n=1 Tax=Clostridium sp. TaxID=1506 RepID=UPI00305F9286
MKKIASIILSGIMILGLVGCSSAGSSDKGEKDKNIPTASIVTSIKEGIEMRPTGPVEGELAKTQYHLNLDDVEEYSIENGMMNSGLEAIAVVKAKAGKVDSVKASLEKVKEDKKAAAFYPGEPEAVEAAKIEVIGNYVALIIIPDYEEGQKNTEKAVEILKEALK